MQNTLTAHKLPPLILHPFADPSGPGKLVESSRASLMLQGLLPTGEQSPRSWRRRCEGRYQEIRMLFYVGRDILRWIEQCVDHVSRYPEMQSVTSGRKLCFVPGAESPRSLPEAQKMGRGRPQVDFFPSAGTERDPGRHATAGNVLGRFSKALPSLRRPDVP